MNALQIRDEPESPDLYVGTCRDRARSATQTLNLSPSPATFQKTWQSTCKLTHAISAVWAGMGAGMGPTDRPKPRWWEDFAQGGLAVETMQEAIDAMITTMEDRNSLAGWPAVWYLCSCDTSACTEVYDRPPSMEALWDHPITQDLRDIATRMGTIEDSMVPNADVNKLFEDFEGLRVLAGNLASDWAIPGNRDRESDGDFPGEWTGEEYASDPAFPFTELTWTPDDDPAINTIEGQSAWGQHIL